MKEILAQRAREGIGCLLVLAALPWWIAADLLLGPEDDTLDDYISTTSPLDIEDEPQPIEFDGEGDLSAQTGAW